LAYALAMGLAWINSAVSAVRNLILTAMIVAALHIAKRQLPLN
jgi:hypothetical protein